MELINALLIEPGMPPRMVMVENTCACISGIIEGEIETVQPWKDNMVAIFARSGGRLRQPNRIIAKDAMYPIPVAKVFGSLLLCAAENPSEDISDGAFCNMSLEQAKNYAFRFEIPDEISKGPEPGQMIWKVHYQALLDNNFESEE